MERYFSALLLFLVFLNSSWATERIGPSLEEQKQIALTPNSAEVLWNITEKELQQDGHWTATTYVSVRMNDQDAARDYGRISIVYNHYYDDLVLDFANSMSTNGEVSAVAKDAIQLRVTGGGQDFYSDSSELIFSLPDILPGSIIEFQFTISSKKLALANLHHDNVRPYWFQRLVGGDGWRADHVINHRFHFSYPDSTHFFTKYFNNYPQPTRNSTSKGLRTTEWVMTNTQGLAFERWLPQWHEITPQISLSTHTDWSVIADWAWHNAIDKFKATDNITTIAKSFLLAPDASREEKIKAVYAYVQNNIRYVFAHLGRGGYEPHFADEVTKSSYGDCKDQTILTVALLKALGVEAYPATVQTPRAGRYDTRLVAMIFDHMIVYIPAAEEQPSLWLDTTGDRSLYPGVSSYLKGQTALIIDGKGGQLTTIDEGLYPNFVTMDIRYHRASDQAVIADVDIIVSGYFEQNTRNWWLYTNNPESALQQMLLGLFSTATGDNVTTSIKNHDSLWEPSKLQARFVFPKQEKNIAYAVSFSQLYNVFGGFRDYQTPGSRQHRFVDDYNTSMKVHAEMEIPGQLIPAVMQSSGDKITPYFSLKQTGEKTESTYTIDMHFNRPALNISAKSYGDYFRGLESFRQLGSWVVDMAERPAIVNPIQAITSSDTLLLIKKNIDNGQFEEALQFAQTAILDSADNGEAWYLLGLAQGLNTLLDESSVSFSRAAELGYFP